MCSWGPIAGSFSLPLAEWEEVGQFPGVTSTLRPSRAEDHVPGGDFSFLIPEVRLGLLLYILVTQPPSSDSQPKFGSCAVAFPSLSRPKGLFVKQELTG